MLTLAGVLLRRWYILVPGAILAAVAGYFVYEAVEPIYEAEAVYVLAGDEPGGGENEEVGVLGGEDATGPVAISGRAIAAVTEGDEIRAQLAEQGFTADYTVTFEADGQLFRVEATASLEDGVVETASAALDAVEEEIERRQNTLGVDPQQRPVFEVLARPTATVATEEVAPDGAVVTTYRSQGVAAIVDAQARPANPVPPNQATAELLATRVGSDVRQAQLQEEFGLTSKYRVRTNRQDALPFVRIDATGTDPGDVLATLSAVRGEFDVELEQRQDAVGVNPAERTQLREVAVATEAEAEAGQAIRPTLTVVGLVIALAVGSALLLEAVTNAIARRRRDDVYLRWFYQGPDSQTQHGDEASVELQRPS